MGKILCLGYEVSRVLLGWLGAILSIIGILMLYFCLENPDVVTKWLISLADDQSKIDYNEMRRGKSYVIYAYIDTYIYTYLYTHICVYRYLHAA